MLHEIKLTFKMCVDDDTHNSCVSMVLGYVCSNVSGMRVRACLSFGLDARVRVHCVVCMGFMHVFQCVALCDWLEVLWGMT